MSQTTQPHGFVETTEGELRRLKVTVTKQHALIQNLSETVEVQADLIRKHEQVVANLQRQIEIKDQEIEDLYYVSGIASRVVDLEAEAALELTLWRLIKRWWRGRF